MNSFMRKRLLALLIACLMLLSSLTAAAEQVLVMRPATVYASADTSKAICTLPAGTGLERAAEHSGWSMVTLNGYTGFVRSENVAVVVDFEGKAAYAAVDAPMYEAFDVKSRKMGVIPAGAEVSVGLVAGEWACVRFGDFMGFVEIVSLTVDAPAKPEQQMLNITAYASADGAKVYNASGKAVGSVPLNTTVTIKAIRDGVCLVERGGATAYMMLSQLSPEKIVQAAPADPIVTIDPTIYYVKVNGAKVYNASGKVIGTLAVDSPVTVTAYNSSLALVSNGSASGLMYRTDLTTDKPAVQEPSDGITVIEPTTFYVRNDGAKLYSGSGKVIGTLPLNYALTVTAANGSLALVFSGGNQALMFLSDLSAEKIEPESQPGSGIIEIEPTTFYVKNDGAKMLDASGKELGTLPLNAAVTVNACSGELARVVNGFVVGFMRKNDLSPEKTEEEKTPEDTIVEITPTTFYVKNDGAKVIDASGAQIASLARDTAVIVNAYSDGLARVINGSVVGFMLKSDLSPEKASPSISYVLQYGDKGEAVKSLQARLMELGYFTGTVGGNYLDITRSAVSAFQSAAKLKVTGVADQATLTALFSDDAPKLSASVGSDGVSTAVPATGNAVEMDWWTSDIQTIFARGVIATVTDVDTGIAWYEKRTGGTNHADVEPATAADTAAMKKAVGSWSWTRRAIFVTINGVNYAASMNAMPHGGDSIANNNFDGHHCIHFTNSRTHGTNKVCSLHQAAIQRAAKAAL